MHCQCIRHFGEALQGESRPDMVPQGSEIILEVIAAGVCHTDLHLREGGLDLGHGQRLRYEERGIEPPLVPGHEIVGRIRAAGPDAAGLDEARTYVVYPWCGCGECDICGSGSEQLCMSPRCLGVHVDGGYASQVRVPHPRYLFDAGDLDPKHAALLACSGLTAYSALKKVEPLLATHPALLLGAGGLGLMCVELMRAVGIAAPVVIEIDPAKREAALKAGARAALDPAEPDVQAQILRACGRAPMAVIDFVGAEVTAALGFTALGKGGTMVLVGLFGGAAPWPLPVIALKSAKIVGSYTGSLGEFAELLEIARSGALRPIRCRSYPLSEADAVLNRLERGEVIGRAVLGNG